MRVRLILATALAVVALPVAAQDVAGRWNASVDTPNGPFAFVLEFMVDAAGALTGTWQNEFFGSTPIREGLVKGNDLSFKLMFEGGPAPMTIGYTGTINGDEIAMTSKIEGTPPPGAVAETSFTATRAK